MMVVTIVVITSTSRLLTMAAGIAVVGPGDDVGVRLTGMLNEPAISADRASGPGTQKRGTASAEADKARRAMTVESLFILRGGYERITKERVGNDKNCSARAVRGVAANGS